MKRISSFLKNGFQMNLSSILNSTAIFSYCIAIIFSIITTCVATVGLTTDYWLFDITEYKFWHIVLTTCIWAIIGIITTMIKNSLYYNERY